MQERKLVHIRSKKFYTNNVKTCLFLSICFPVLSTITVLAILSSLRIGAVILLLSIVTMFLMYLKYKGKKNKTCLICDMYEQDATLLYIISLYCEPMINMCIVATIFLLVNRM